MAATLRLVRKGHGIELRRGTYHVLLDDEDVATIEWHQTIEVPMERGRHTLQLAKGRYTSAKQSFEVDDLEVVDFRCHGALIWPVWVASFVMPSLGIVLKRA